MNQRFALPDVGEGLTEAEIVTWKVKPGDTVALNDVLLEIETAKSLVELPSPYAGVVAELLVAEGDTVEVGTDIVVVDDGSGAAAGPADPEPAAEPASEPAEPADEPAEPAAVAEASPQPAPDGGSGATLVGYGSREVAPRRRGARTTREPAPAPGPAPGAPAAHVLAKPPVRKLARDLGVDLARAVPTGPGGTVTRADVLALVPAAPAEPPRRVEQHARERHVPIRGIRKATAAAMVESAFSAPHVTVFTTVDATRTMKLVQRLKTDPEFAGIKVSPLLLVAKALLVAVRRNPDINATWDEENQVIVVKNYVNLGIAVATPRGLLVPNVKDADEMTLKDLAVHLNSVAGTAREGRAAPRDLAGGTITISNVGTFGIDTGTPILNPGEAAILAVGKIAQRPWVHKGKIKPRYLATLGLSFDHRMLDGESGSRALADVAAVLEDPARALTWS
ncbi:dihydrolipoamide acetyltransferase family protein [Kineococcus radiotolerans]|uniref:Dihydrolipoamide acetyltransferase component of pyruvate dehydrogenase complex n=1 Tax=Kineococcus radiotolerans (strain ATCC BAA-149 / DSM 14245 / SRS30216) TaxID=266940 RepID=A6WG10_KINRD|nr:dihydrolipoamide acetyltransferase family protein [Kineococcus radiotolerans]ABS05749.1 catalytic domain of components of various dehydrogenase complexes [Kineococcus radiotolerans SRS30216 = ATCC BAA-149]